MRHYNPDLLKRAKELRRRPSKSEVRLWARLRSDQLGVRFRFQFPVDNYVLDFYCAKAKLAVELDGEQHFSRRPEDEERDAHLQALGIKTIRFWTTEVWDNLDGVVDVVWRELQERLSEQP